MGMVPGGGGGGVSEAWVCMRVSACWMLHGWCT